MAVTANFQHVKTRILTQSYGNSGLAAVYGGTLMALRKATRTSHLPLGPFILIGTLAGIAL
jgi:prepilin signal peptidase PulO-like enzyme (type II secretory pathway)